MLIIGNAIIEKIKAILDSTDMNRSTVSRYLEQYNSIQKAYEMQRSKWKESNAKMNQLELDKEEWEEKLEKERDCLATEKFNLIEQEEEIAYSIGDFLVEQKAFYDKASKNIEVFLSEINEIVEKNKKKRVFNITLKEHLYSTKRTISFVIEMCVCCLIDLGLCKEELLRDECSSAKLKIIKNSIDKQYGSPPLPPEYQDVNGTITDFWALQELHVSSSTTYGTMRKTRNTQNHKSAPLRKLRQLKVYYTMFLVPGSE